MSQVAFGGDLAFLFGERGVKMKFIPIVAFLVVLISQFAWSGQIEIWEDDQGVTHIEYQKSNTQKSSSGTHQKSNRQYEDYIRKIEQQKAERQRKQEALIRKMQHRKSEYQRKLEEHRRKSERVYQKIERQLPEIKRKQKELDREYERLTDRTRKGAVSGDAITRNKDNRSITQTTGTIMGNCTRKWGNNYMMVEHCVKTQTEAQKAIIGKSGIIRDNCEKKWGDNYMMVEHCIKTQETAKNNIERNYSGDKLSFCKRKWGNNYMMVEHCLNN